VLSKLCVKGDKNTKTNKIILLKNRKLATQNFLFNFPFGRIKRLSLFMENMLK